MTIPSIMIAAPQGRSGKTIVATGLCAALHRNGLAVKPFKKGPDYIDPSWLAAAASESCTNLDPYMFSDSTITTVFERDCAGADIAVIEGSMGLYDTTEEAGRGSSAWLARLLQIPVILVVNASRMGRSAAAMIKGYQDFEAGTNIAGVILNNVSGSRHRGKLVSAIEANCRISVLGAIPRTSGLKIQERHLGIVPFVEQTDAGDTIDRIRALIENNVDLDRIIAIAHREAADSHCVTGGTPSNIIASSTPPHNNAGIPPSNVIARSEATKQSPGIPSVKIAVLRDKAFSFYYPDNLQALQEAGAELIYINSFQDTLPEYINGVYIGGGFPELYAADLEANAVLRHSIARLAGEGLPIYAECAGLMYLCRSVIISDRSYQMSGVFDCDAVIQARPQGHGYMEVEVTGGNHFFVDNSVIRGHEFHHSRLVNTAGLDFAFSVKRGRGIDGGHDGIIRWRVLASYMHIHVLSAPSWAENFVKLCSDNKINLLKTLA